ncbi:tripartite tricarboxylate transporter substrate binding protein [Elioraea sp. Yellowstone]|jgi:tripartite-type tricarboxylate transporter receptor subunit TctC|uniref:Bug family tripartite tricarboxylate transporter substrate binding protein n=1 Tax=Elioraea sp. Yellowstone TaxID=2592070 RepID=UPI0011546C4C|nr:tripartite tricarboxylate transporter substrate binding protein [Elioraea sp. Yellowstone]TQF76955.1 tripartite tricarboxylate transporter substrate binding protein [Elioraea sp. Yellowstone]
MTRFSLARRALLALAIALPAVPTAAQGAWPDRPLRIIVPAPGGGGTADTIARILAQELEPRLGTRVLIENRGGANGNIGAAEAARAAPDGYTFLFSWAGTLATNLSLYRTLAFHPQRDFEPIVFIGTVPNILVVNKDLPVRTLKEFEDHARAHPGAINFGSTGNGSSMHLAAEMFKTRTGVEMTHVPYQSPATATNDLIAGRIQAMFQLVVGIQGQVKGDLVRPIAVLAESRAPQLPEVPTTAEQGMPGLVFGTWFGLLAPKGTPAPILARMNAEMNAVLDDAAARARLVQAGLAVGGGTPGQFAAFLDSEIRSHAELVRAAGVRID